MARTRRWILCSLIGGSTVAAGAMFPRQSYSTLETPFSIIDLGTAQSARETQCGLNNHGQIVRFKPERGFHTEIHTVDDSTPRDLAIDSPVDVNNYGQVLGVSLADGTKRIVLCDRCGRREILTGFPSSSVPRGFNDRCDVVGFYCDENRCVQGFVWTRDLGFRPVHSDSKRRITFAEGINADGDIVGQFVDQGIARAFLSKKTGEFVDLHPAQAESSTACAINASNVVVGYCTIDGKQTAFEWSPSFGHKLLQKSIDQTKWSLLKALDINDNGDILCYAQNGQAFHLLVVKPSHLVASTNAHANHGKFRSAAQSKSTML